MFGPQINISEREFGEIRDLMYEKTGVLLRPSKKPLVITRLRSRLSELGLTTFTAYLDHLRRTGKPELEIIINAITTNETFFFRHENQFNLLFETVLPEIVKKKENGPRELKIWSAASSTGEEPYSLAMALLEFFSSRPGWRLKVCASDVNTEVLEEAQEGRYNAKSVRLVPNSLKSKYFEHVPAPANMPFAQDEYVVCQKVRSLVEFRQHNILHPAPFRNMDVIFLRNVLIYFDKDSKRKAIDMLTESLPVGGYLFISLSETLNDIQSRFKFLKTGAYTRDA
jgi:chemotaxis protein methyltransferase CheR